MRHLYTLTLVCFALFVQAQTTAPQKLTGSKFSIKCANLYFEVDSAKGARIVSFKVDDQDLLYFNPKDLTSSGSTFWPSPQSVWNWPPLANLDSSPYKTSIKGNTLKFTGSTDTKTNLRFYKQMYANPTDTSIVIEYTMKNEKASTQKWAPWEVSRVVGKGITVFAKGEGSVTGKMSSFSETIGDYVWYDQDQHSSTSSDFKFFSDGKGWLAHVVDGNKVFIKKFDNIESTEAAPGEAEVEVYTANKNVYTELENQGAYTTIAAKDSATWKVKWFARKLPATVDVSVGSKSLTDYIEAVLKRETEVVSGSKDKFVATINVYPNPASSFIQVQTNLSDFSNASICVFNLQGQMVMTQTLFLNRQSIDVKALQKGTYFYQIRKDAQLVGKGRFMVNR
jgi:hypothetical protein